MSQTPLFIRRLIKTANHIDNLTQDQIRVLVVQALDMLASYSQSESPDLVSELRSAKDYLRALERSLHPIHAADAKRAFINAADAIRQLGMTNSKDR